jgi:hypothetical protein
MPELPVEFRMLPSPVPAATAASTIAPAQGEPEESDKPLDAIVYEVHPAVDPEYPYAPRVAAAEQPPVSFRPHELVARWIEKLNLDPPRKADYQVPQRFGMSAILGIMTMLALIFGLLRRIDMPPAGFLFFGMQAIVICLAQMFQGKTPRAASAAAGGLLLPLFILFGFAFSGSDGPWSAVMCALVFSVPFGAFLGYLMGTCAAGVFLLMDGLERYLKGQRPIFPSGPIGRAPVARGT